MILWLFSWIKRNWFVSEDEAHCTYIRVKNLVAMVNNLRLDASPLLGNHFLQLINSKILDRNQNRIYVNPGLYRSRATFKFWTFFMLILCNEFWWWFFFKKWWVKLLKISKMEDVSRNDDEKFEIVLQLISWCWIKSDSLD